MKKFARWLGMSLYLLGAGATWAAPTDVPIGTVLDWWRPDASWPVPEGYQICDGSLVTDSRSPLLNQSMPNLVDKFVMGVTDPTRIGISGGSVNHGHVIDLNHAHSTATTDAAGAHAHLIDVPVLSAQWQTDAAGSHSHHWLRFAVVDKKQFLTYSASGQLRLISLWSNGIGDSGSGIYPFAKMDLPITSEDFYTAHHGGHRHGLSLAHDHPAFNSAAAAAHSHSLAVPPLGMQVRQSSVELNVPPFIGLLKIMRVF